MLPSPTAAATRLTGPNRTSPHAKMPGTLVSSKYGSRSCSQRPAARRSVPVSTYPRSSSAISLGSHAVSASAPMKTKRPPDAKRLVAPVARSRMSIASSDASPCTRDHLDAEECVDAETRRQLVDQVARHALLERVASAEDRHAPRVIREEEGGLPGRVARPDDVDVEPVRVRCLAPCRAVRDPLADELVEPLDRQAAP